MSLPIRSMSLKGPNLNPDPSSKASIVSKLTWPCYTVYDKTGRIFANNRNFPHLPGQVADNLRYLLVCIICIDYFDQFHDGRRIKEMHSKEPARLQNFTGYAGNRKRGGVSSEYSFIVIDRCQLVKQMNFCFYAFNNG